MPDASIYNVGWICAIRPEYVAAQAFLDEKHDRPDHVGTSDSNIYTLGRLGKHNVVVGTLPDGEYGIAAAVGVAKGMLSSFPNVRIGLMVGIAGGAPSSKNDIRLGDVVVSAPRNGHGGVFQYDFGKTIQDKKFQPVGFLNQPPELLRAALTDIQAEYEMDGHQLEEAINATLNKRPKLRQKYQRPNLSSDRLFRSGLVHREIDSASCAFDCYEGPSSLVERRERTNKEDNPAVHYGTIASANQLMKDAFIRDRLAEEEDVLCFEMEAAGLMNRFPCLVVRGICDYADSHKNKEWQGYAAMTAAAYAKDLLKRISPNRVEAETKISELVENANEGLGKVLSVSLETKAAVQGIQTSSHFDKITKWLSAPDPSNNLNKARELYQPGTGRWLLDSQKYRSWKTDSASFLWLYGIPGCGKTILSSTVIADLAEDAIISPNLLYFYFNFGEMEKRSTGNAVRSLINQLYCKSIEARAVVDSVYASQDKHRGQPTLASLQQVLQGMIGRCQGAWIILDGIDECETRNGNAIDNVLLWIKSLSSLSNVHILITSRLEEDIKSSVEAWASAKEMVSLHSDLVADDISAYIHKKVEGMGRWQTQPDVQKLITTTLNERASGMFRWVACQFDALERCLSRKEILRDLAELPRTLDETYERIFERIYPGYKPNTIRLLQLLTYSERPLRLEEAVDAIAVEPANTPRFDTGNRIQFPKEITRYVSGFVSLINNYNTKREEYVIEIQLAHFSVREYLQSSRLKPALRKHLDKTAAAAAMADLCLSYLLQLDGSMPLDEIDEQYPFAGFAATYWSDYAAIMESSNHRVLDTLKEYYASKGAFTLGCLLYRPDYPNYTRAGFPNYGPDKDVSPLYYASFAGLLDSVHVLLKGDVDVNVHGGRHGNPLQAASYAGHNAVVQLLLQHGANINAPFGEYGNPLQAASFAGHYTVVQLLIQHGANINAQGGWYGNALYAASNRGHKAIVEILIQNRANVHAEGGQHGSALRAALAQGKLSIVKILLENGARKTRRGAVSFPKKY